MKNSQFTIRMNLYGDEHQIERISRHFDMKFHAKYRIGAIWMPQNVHTMAIIIQTDFQPNK